ncbi:hypothetical protein BAA13334_I03094 [Brucella abortus A13334]|nr:No hit [Brucella canis HSK A52141]AEW18311.1 hypothetical protein BAA13334_I03094 [Brucella abortus A13334]
MSASVISGVNSSPVLKPAEHIFDLMTPFIEDRIIWDDILAVGS